MSWSVRSGGEELAVLLGTLLRVAGRAVTLLELGFVLLHQLTRCGAPDLH